MVDSRYTGVGYEPPITYDGVEDIDGKMDFYVSEIQRLETENTKLERLARNLLGDAQFALWETGKIEFTPTTQIKEGK